MSLKADSYDPSEVIDCLIEDAQAMIGKPVWRIAGPEIEWFIRKQVAYELRNAFKKAESLYIDDMVKQANQGSRNMLNAVLAGAKIAELKKEKKE